MSVDMTNATKKPNGGSMTRYHTQLEADGRRDDRYVDAKGTEEAAYLSSKGWRSGCSTTKDRTGRDAYGEYDRYIVRSQGFVAAVRVYLPTVNA
jgi:hypothetical protein